MHNKFTNSTEQTDQIYESSGMPDIITSSLSLIEDQTMDEAQLNRLTSLADSIDKRVKRNEDNVFVAPKKEERPSYLGRNQPPVATTLA